jgi:hypothetical protein
VSTEGWIFMVGFRVFDVGLLVIWLIWFFRLRDDGDEPPGDDGGGGEGPGPRPNRDGPGGEGIRLPLGRWAPGRGRDREHSSPGGLRRRRGGTPVTRPLPSRVRRPASPVPAHHRD